MATATAPKKVSRLPLKKQAFSRLSELVPGLEVRQKIPLSRWARQNVIIPAGLSKRPGRFDPDIVPYATEPGDVITSGNAPVVIYRADPQSPDGLAEYVTIGNEHVIYVGPAQSSKTQTLNLNVITWIIDQDPSPGLYVMQDHEEARDIAEERLWPQVNATPALREKLYKRRQKKGSSAAKRLSYRGGNFVLRGANVPGKLSSRPRKWVIMDERSQWKSNIQGQGNPGQIAIARTKTYGSDRRILETGSCTVKGRCAMEKGYEDSSQARYTLPCPACGHRQELTWESKRLDLKTCLYQCENEECLKSFNRSQWFYRWERNGRWVHKFPERRKKGYWLSGLYAAFTTWEEIREEFFRATALAKKGDVTNLITCLNTTLNILWEERGETIDEDLYNNRREVYAAEVPDGVRFLTAAIDTQKHSFEIEICGWGPARERWGLYRISIDGDPREEDTQKRLDQLLFQRRFTFSDGRKTRIIQAFLDTGGLYTTAMYKYTKGRSPLLYGTKGFAGEDSSEIIGKVQTMVRSWLIKLGVDRAKLNVFAHLRVQQPGPGYWHWPKGEAGGARNGYSEDYFFELTQTELFGIKRSRGKEYSAWTQKEHTRNEALDLAVLNSCCLEMLILQGRDPAKMPRFVLAQREDTKLEDSQEKVATGPRGYRVVTQELEV